jgi:hypothetical protein
MKRILLSVLAVFLMGGLMAQTDTVTFNVTVPTDSTFNAKTDSVFVTGTMTGWAQPGSVDSLRMLPNSDSTSYSLTLPGVADGEIQYKYFIINKGPDWNQGEWAGDPNRRAVIAGKTTIKDTWGEKPFDITFRVNVGSILDSITKSKALVFIAGTVANGWAQPGSIHYYQLKPIATGDSIYSIDLWLYKGKIQFKYFLVFDSTASWSYGEWNGGDNRMDSIVGADTLNSVWGDLGFTGIPTNNAPQPNFRIYPNPVHRVLYIDNLENANRIEIFNVIGQKVREIRNIDGRRLTIQTGDLNNGMYVIAAFGEKGVIKSMKFIKQ